MTWSGHLSHTAPPVAFTCYYYHTFKNTGSNNSTGLYLAPPTVAPPTGTQTGIREFTVKISFILRCCSKTFMQRSAFYDFKDFQKILNAPIKELNHIILVVSNNSPNRERFCGDWNGRISRRDLSGSFWLRDQPQDFLRDDSLKRDWTVSNGPITERLESQGQSDWGVNPFVFAHIFSL